MTREQKKDLTLISILLLIVISFGIFLYLDTKKVDNKEITVYEYNNLLNIKKIINNKELEVINIEHLNVYETKKIEITYRDAQTFYEIENIIRKMISLDQNNKNLKEIKSLIEKEKITNKEYKMIINKVFELNNDIEKTKEEKNNKVLEKIKKEIKE